MRIEQDLPASVLIAQARVGRVSSRRSNAGASFTVQETEDQQTECLVATDALPAAARMQPQGQLDALPAAALPPDIAQERQRAAGQGRALLGCLAGLQAAVLDGSVASGGRGVQLRRTLADLARALPISADPGLDAVLQAIAQRAAIELARSE